MIKILKIIFVTILIFSSALYNWIFWLIGDSISTFTSDFLPYIPMELRLTFFIIILALLFALDKSFTN